ncbi:unnamed protein product [Mortierella alpina]
MDPESDLDPGTHATASAAPHTHAATRSHESPEVALERLAASYLAGGPQNKSGPSSGTSTPATASSPSALPTQGTRMAFPFSSFSLHLPPTSSLPGSPQEQPRHERERTQEHEHEYDHEQDGSGVEGSTFAPKPLAVKPAYKKREVVVASRADGIVRSSGAKAVNEKRMMIDHKMKVRAGGNIYDKTAELQWMAREQDRMARKLKRLTPRPTKTPKPPAAPRFVQPKVIKPLPVWRPEPLRGVMKAQTARPGPRSVNSGLIPPVNREAPIESLSKQREVHRERLAQLATRPMPLRDLRTLITAELEHEHTVLNELGTQLHKELLKLQLEEGVLINMFKQSSDGLLSNADLVRVRPYKDPSKKELRKMERARKRQAAQALATHKRRMRALGVPLMDVGNVMELGVTMDLDQEPDFMRLNESYSSRPIATSQGLGEPSSVGRPKASAPHALASLENISNPAIERGQRKASHNRHLATTSSTIPMDVDMREPDDTPAGGHGGQDEEATYNSSDYEDEDGDEVEEEDEDEYEIQEVDAYDDDEGDDEDDDDDDDDDEDEDEDDEEEDDDLEGGDQEDAARMALQQMLSMYGAG